MKTNITILCAALALVSSPVLRAEAADAHAGHDHAGDAHAGHVHAKKEAGPNGGRVITSVEPHFEFLVTPEGKAQITFLGEDGKAIAPAGQVITAVGGDRANPTRLSFGKGDGVLISDKALPEGISTPIILQVKISPDAKTVNEKFMVNLADCSSCEYKEYACTCAH